MIRANLLRPAMLAFTVMALAASPGAGETKSSSAAATQAKRSATALLQSQARNHAEPPVAMADPEILNLTGVNLANDDPQCRFTEKPSLGQTYFYGKVTVRDFLMLANEAEVVSEQGTKTDKIGPDVLNLIRDSANRIVRGWQYNEPIELAPHEAIALCGLSVAIMGRNIVDLR